MRFSSLSACVLLLSSGAAALRHGEPDNGLAEPLWAAPHVAHHQDQRRDGFIKARGKRSSYKAHMKLHARQPPPPPPPGPPPPPPPGSGAPPKWQNPSTPAKTVKVKVGELWRGETFRKPEDVRKAGGFESHAKRIFEGTHPDYKSGMTKEAFAMGSSLYHHSKKTCSCSSYVSMSASKDEATNFASKQTAEKTFVYKIRPETSKVVDVAGSLGGDRHLTWSKEKEIAGVYEVPWSRVLGWHEGTPTKVDGGGSEIIFSDFIAKGDVYPDDPLPEEGALSGDFEIRSELAGFPDGHLGRTELPWKEYNDVPVEEWLNEYMLQRNFNKDEAQFKAARKAEDWANLPCSSQKRKRAGASEACDRVNKQDSESTAEEGVKEPTPEEEEEVTKPESPEEGVKEPTPGEEGLISEGGSGSGSGAGEVEVPKITEKWAAAAEELSKREFTDLVTSRRLAKFVSEKLKKTVTDIRGKWLGYKALTANSPKFQTIYGIAGKIAKPLEKLGKPLWALGVVDAFARETTALEKTAALTAMLPIVGCTADAAAKGQKGTISPLDTTLCYLADGLMFTPFWPAAIVIQALRVVINAFIPPDVPEPADLLATRDDTWAGFLDEGIYKYIYAHNYTSPDRTFFDRMNSTFSAESLLVLSEVAADIAATNVTGQSAMEAEKDEGRRAAIWNETQVATDAMREGIPTEMGRRQRKALLDMPDSLAENSGVSLKPLAETFNKEYTSRLTSDEFRKKYVDILKINEDEVRGKLKNASEFVQSKPLKMPTTFDIAYILGQSKALESIEPNALSAREYITDQAPDLSEQRVNYFALHHTLQVAKLFRGTLGGGEEKLDQLWPSDQTAAVRPLQLLIAMKYGRAFDVLKVKHADAKYTGVNANLLSEATYHYINYANIPPVSDPTGVTEETSYLGFILGLSEEIVRNIPRGVKQFTYADLVNNPEVIKSLLALEIKLREDKAKAVKAAKAAKAGGDKTEQVARL